MDEYSFQSELKNYKVIRRADFHKVYWNKKYQVYNTKNSNDYFYYILYSIEIQGTQNSQGQHSNKKSKPLKNPSDKPIATDVSIGFWELFENSLKGTLNPVEINRFLANVRQVIIKYYMKKINIYMLLSFFIVFCNLSCLSRNILIYTQKSTYQNQTRLQIIFEISNYKYEI